MPAQSYATDYYERLGIGQTEDVRLIRRQYRLLARLFHPDVSEAADAQVRFQALQEAYAILSDDEKRRDFDRWLGQQSSVRRPLQMTLHYWPQTLARPVGKQRFYALLDVNANKDIQAGQVALNVVLVLDRSSSMKGQRLHYVKEATRRIVDNLAPHDIFGIVTFNDRASVVLPTGYATNAHVARSAIEGIAATGGTEVASGLRLGIQEVLRHHSTNVVSHVILLTDGRTYGDEAMALDLATKAGEEGIGITAMGLGTDWNDEFLDDLAQRTGGSSHFIAKPDQAVAVFQSQLQQLQRTYARNARLSLNLGPGIQLMQAHEVAPGLRELAQQDGEIALGSLPAEPPLRLLLDFSTTLPDRDVLLLGHFELKAQLLQDSITYRVERMAVADVGEAVEESPAEPIYQGAQRVATLRLQNRTWENLAKGQGEEGTAAALEHLANRFLEIGADDLALATRREMENYQKTGALSDDGRMAIKYGTRLLALPSPGEETPP